MNISESIATKAAGDFRKTGSPPNNDILLVYCAGSTQYRTKVLSQVEEINGILFVDKDDNVQILHLPKVGIHSLTSMTQTLSGAIGTPSEFFPMVCSLESALENFVTWGTELSLPDTIRGSSLQEAIKADSKIPAYTNPNFLNDDNSLKELDVAAFSIPKLIPLTEDISILEGPLDNPDIAAQFDTLPPIIKIWGQAHLYKLSIDETYLKTSVSTLAPPSIHDIVVSDELTFEFKLAPKGKQ